jgi:serine protease Do
MRFSVSRCCRRAVLAIVVAAGPGAAVSATPIVAQTAQGQLLPDVISRVIDSVVLISTSEKLPGSELTPPPDLGPDSDLDQFFKKFFDRQRRGEGDERETGEGSGFVVNASGIIVTNYHVIEDSDRIEVTFNDGSKLPAEVVGTDKLIDIAVLKVKPPKPLKAVTFGDSDRLRVGQTVIAMGNPFGIGLSASAGIVSGRNRNIRNGPYDDFIQTDAAINKGNSGGPLFNLEGKVIGMDTAILSPTGSSVGIGFAVPSNELQPALLQIETYGEVRRGHIGVRVEDVPAEVATRLRMDKPSGALVADVVPGGPAAQAGIRQGDIITSFDQQPVTDARTLQRAVGEAGVDRVAHAEIRRGAATIGIYVRIARDTPAPKPAPAPSAAHATPPPGPVLGLDLAKLDANSRHRFKIAPGVERGVVILAVLPSSPLKSLDLHVGDTIVSVEQQQVTTPDELRQRIDALKHRGVTKVLMWVAHPDGSMRFLRVPAG